MTLCGTAFLPIWHDVDAEMEAEFNQWHTVEHMPERLDTPGIVIGRRYADPAAPLYRYFTLYEAVSFDVFASEGYYATANARSEWTQRVHPHFQNFKRAPCHLVMTRGRGIGGGLATIRINFAPQDHSTYETSISPISPKDKFNLVVRPLVEAITEMDFITSVHAGITAPVARSPLSQQSLSLRPNAMAFDAVLMIEGISRTAVKNALPAIENLLQNEKEAIQSYETGTYDLAYMISSQAGW